MRPQVSALCNWKTDLAQGISGYSTTEAVANKIYFNLSYFEYGRQTEKNPARKLENKTPILLSSNFISKKR